jgi:tetratricopeptide (TPR) repeat protein
MVRGKLDGPVVSTDPSGKTVQLTFVNGSKVGERTDGSQNKAEDEQEEEHQQPRQRHHQQPHPDQRAETTPDAPSPTPRPPRAQKDPVAADLKEQTESVLSQVASATGDFQDIERLESVQELPAPVSESISTLGNRTRELRAKIGRDSSALNEYRPEIVTAEALSLIKQVSRDIAMSDAAEANSKLADFLQSNPEPAAENQKPLWRYLKSLQNLCDRLEKEAEIHLQRAQSLAAANKTSEAIREYQEAYRMFPNPATAGKIRELQDNSLGL